MHEFLCSDNHKGVWNQQHEKSVVGEGALPSQWVRMIDDQL